MPLNASQLRAVVFDYGNTLIEFTASQVAHLDRAIAESLLKTFGRFDERRYHELRRDAYRAPYSHPELREKTIPQLLTDLVDELFDHSPSVEQLQAIIAVHDEQFVRCIEAPDYLHGLLDRLRMKYRLAVVSNYPCGKSIRASLARTGILERVETVVVSGDVGFVKPHPLLFTTVLDQLRLQPHEAVYIGDNWLGDIQGAKRAGMAAVHTLQFDTLEKFDRQHGDHDADLVIRDLRELIEHL
jgi:HAD superfamily hydrolase (TIGR01549 family)